MKVFARCNCRKELILHLVSKKKKKKKGLFGDTLSLTTSHLLLLDVTPVKNIKNTEMAKKILKNGKKILKAPSQGWRHCDRIGLTEGRDDTEVENEIFTCLPDPRNCNSRFTII